MTIEPVPAISKMPGSTPIDPIEAMNASLSMMTCDSGISDSKVSL